MSGFSRHQDLCSASDSGITVSVSLKLKVIKESTVVNDTLTIALYCSYMHISMTNKEYYSDLLK